MNQTIFYIHKLKDELSSRCERNSRYSLRAFAHSMEVDVGALSRVLSGKQIPSHKLTTKFLKALGLDSAEYDHFLTSLSEAQKKRPLQRRSPHFKMTSPHSRPTSLNHDAYRIISEWYHMAILELTFTEDFNSDPNWIAHNLGISVTESRLAVDRLLNLGLLKMKNSRLTKTSEQLSTEDKHLTTPALKRNQKQFLEKALYSLENDKIEERNMSSMTMAIDPKKIKAAKKMIHEFNQELCKFLESGKRKRVYNLEISLYPLQLNKGK